MEEDDDAGGGSDVYKYGIYGYCTPRHFHFDGTTSSITPAVLWKGYTQRTVAHGCPNFDIAKGYVKRSMWILSLLLMIIGMLYNIRGLVSDYLQYSVTAQVSIVRGQPIIFPAVTICNMNPVRNSAYQTLIDSAGGGPVKTGKRRRKRSGCPASWYQNGTMCYYISTATDSQPGAITDCEGLEPGAQLVSILNAQESDFISYLTSSIYGTNAGFWIGFQRYSTDAALDGNGYWVDNCTSPTGYSNWMATYPSTANKDCVRLSGVQGQWRDTTCTTTYQYICKLNLQGGCLNGGGPDGPIVTTITTPAPTSKHTTSLTSTKTPATTNIHTTAASLTTTTPPITTTTITAPITTKTSVAASSSTPGLTTTRTTTSTTETRFTSTSATTTTVTTTATGSSSSSTTSSSTTTSTTASTATTRVISISTTKPTGTTTTGTANNPTTKSTYTTPGLTTTSIITSSTTTQFSKTSTTTASVTTTATTSSPSTTNTTPGMPTTSTLILPTTTHFTTTSTAPLSVTTTATTSNIPTIATSTFTTPGLTTTTATPVVTKTSSTSGVTSVTATWFTSTTTTTPSPTTAATTTNISNMTSISIATSTTSATSESAAAATTVVHTTAITSTTTTPTTTTITTTTPTTTAITTTKTITTTACSASTVTAITIHGAATVPSNALTTAPIVSISTSIAYTTTSTAAITTTTATTTATTMTTMASSTTTVTAITIHGAATVISNALPSVAMVSITSTAYPTTSTTAITATISATTMPTTTMTATVSSTSTVTAITIHGAATVLSNALAASTTMSTTATTTSTAAITTTITAATTTATTTMTTTPSNTSTVTAITVHGAASVISNALPSVAMVSITSTAYPITSTTAITATATTTATTTMTTTASNTFKATAITIHEAATVPSNTTTAATNTTTTVTFSSFSVMNQTVAVDSMNNGATLLANFSGTPATIATIPAAILTVSLTSAQEISPGLTTPVMVVLNTGQAGLTDIPNSVEIRTTLANVNEEETIISTHNVNGQETTSTANINNAQTTITTKTNDNNSNNNINNGETTAANNLNNGPTTTTNSTNNGQTPMTANDINNEQATTTTTANKVNNNSMSQTTTTYNIRATSMTTTNNMNGGETTATAFMNQSITQDNQVEQLPITSVTTVTTETFSLTTTLENIQSSSLSTPTTPNLFYSAEMQNSGALRYTAVLQQSNVLRCCCCQCTSTSGPAQTCCNSSLEGASSCAVQISFNPPQPLSPSPSAETPSLSSAPNLVVAEPLVGSHYPGRLALTPSFEQQQILTEEIQALPAAAKSDIGFSIESLIVNCTFAGNRCSLDDQFEPFYNPTQGMCYIFNSGWNSTYQLLNTSLPGREFGLQMIVNIDQDDYLKNMGNTAGLRVVILPQYQMPFPEDFGITLSPGLYTSIGISQRLDISRLSEPFSDCYDASVFNPQLNVYGVKYPVEYSTSVYTNQACQKTCYQRHVIDACSCADAYYPYGPSFDLPDVPICSVTNMTQDDCRYEAQIQYSSGQLNCQCPERCSTLWNHNDIVFVCRDSLYDSQTSFASWPSQNGPLSVLYPSFAAPFNTAEGVSNNLLKFDLFFTTMDIEQIVETPAMTLNQLLVGISGLLLLWLGLVLVSLFEILELCVDAIILAIHKRLWKKRHPLSVADFEIP